MLYPCAPAFSLPSLVKGRIFNFPSTIRVSAVLFPSKLLASFSSAVLHILRTSSPCSILSPSIYHHPFFQPHLPAIVSLSLILTLASILSLCACLLFTQQNDGSFLLLIVTLSSELSKFASCASYTSATVSAQETDATATPSV